MATTNNAGGRKKTRFLVTLKRMIGIKDPRSNKLHKFAQLISARPLTKIFCGAEFNQMERYKMKQSFKDLVTGLCALKQLGDPEPFVYGEPLDVNGVRCTLIYNEQINPDQLYMYIAFDYAPHEKEGEIYKLLLQQNHSGFAGRGPGFCISPTTGMVGYVIRIDLDEVTPNKLASSLTYYADKAIEWKNTFFLDKRTPGSRRPAFISNMPPA